jgi:hypothetical protein
MTQALSSGQNLHGCNLRGKDSSKLPVVKHPPWLPAELQPFAHVSDFGAVRQSETSQKLVAACRPQVLYTHKSFHWAACRPRELNLNARPQARFNDLSLRAGIEFGAESQAVEAEAQPQGIVDFVVVTR